jgi:hypothetical protein
MVTGLSWSFEQVEEAIVLEEGFVPERTFFPFCDELLSRYRGDQRVMHINGCSRDRHAPAATESYRFTQFIEGRAWATWRRAWKHFDLLTSLWPQVRTLRRLDSILENNATAVRYYHEKFNQAYDHPYNPPTLSYWQHQWSFACWSNSGLGVTPACNLISHTTRDADSASELVEVPTRSMPFPLLHPASVRPDYDRDRIYFNTVLLPEIAAVQRPSRLRTAISSITRRPFQSIVHRSAVGAAITPVPQKPTSAAT